MKREDEEEKTRAKLAARERVLHEFERGQLGLAATSTTGTTSAGLSSEGMSVVLISPCYIDVLRQGVEAQILV